MPEMSDLLIAAEFIWYLLGGLILTALVALLVIVLSPFVRFRKRNF